MPVMPEATAKEKLEKRVINMRASRTTAFEVRRGEGRWTRGKDGARGYAERSFNSIDLSGCPINPAPTIFARKTNDLQTYSKLTVENKKIFGELSLNSVARSCLYD